MKDQSQLFRWLSSDLHPPRRGARPRVEALERRELPAAGLTALHIDFGGPGTPVASGYTAVGADAYVPTAGYGWEDPSAVLGWRDRGTADALATDFVFGTDATFRADLADGTYAVTARMADNEYAHDRIAVWANGTRAASDISTDVHAPATVTFQAQVADGRLELRFADEGGADPYFVLNSLDVTPVSGNPSPGGTGPAASAGSGTIPVSSTPTFALTPVSYADSANALYGSRPLERITPPSAPTTPVTPATPVAAPAPAPAPAPVPAPAAVPPSGVPGQVGLTAGWATFGEALPDGFAFGPLQVGSLATQTDVKTRWADGSIKFAVVTALVPADGTYQITRADAAPAGSITAPNPDAAVEMTIDGVTYTAAVPRALGSDVWLSGPDVSERRYVVTPVAPDGTPHPFLRVVFDVRTFADGKARLDVTADNTLDQANATAVTYALDVVTNGQTLFHRDAVTQYYLTRWRKVFDLGGLTESQVTPDLSGAYQSGALPRYLASVTDEVDSPTGPDFDIMGSGDLTTDMGTPGGRPEIAPYPDWAARYLVYLDPTQRQYVLAEGDLAGSWPVHVTNPDGSLITLDQRPDYWLDSRWSPWLTGPQGANDLTDAAALGPLHAENAHVPSLAYLPYLLTGDRYYADEMKFWASDALLTTYPAGDLRGGAQGILASNQTRGIAWGLRNMADAAAYLPDGDPFKAYLAQKVENNLQWLDGMAANHAGPLGVAWLAVDPPDSQTPQAVVSLWAHNYLAWAIDHANQLGFAGGDLWRDQLAKFQIGLFNSPDYPIAYAAPYRLAIGAADGNGGVSYFSTLGQVADATATYLGSPTPLWGNYGVDARLDALIGVANGWAGAQSALDYIDSIIAKPDPYGVSDLTKRAGWAIAPE